MYEIYTYEMYEMYTNYLFFYLLTWLKLNGRAVRNGRSSTSYENDMPACPFYLKGVTKTIILCGFLLTFMSECCVMIHATTQKEFIKGMRGIKRD